MAQSVHLRLEIDGEPCCGESSIKDLGRKDTIECVYYESGIVTAQDAGSENVSGSATLVPTMIRKRIDKSTPIIADAILKGTKVKASFLFYRSKNKGAGEQHFFTITMANARIASQEFCSPSTLVPSNSLLPPMEMVTFAAPTCRWEYEDGHVPTDHSWDGDIVASALQMIEGLWGSAKE